MTTFKDEIKFENLETPVIKKGIEALQKATEYLREIPIELVKDSTFFKIVGDNFPIFLKALGEENQKRITPQDKRDEEWKNRTLEYCTDKIGAINSRIQASSLCNKYGNISYDHKSHDDFVRAVGLLNDIKTIMDPTKIAAEERYLEEKRLGLIANPFEDYKD